MTLALLCSGQGHQGPRLFDLTRDLPAAAPLFAQGKALLGGRDPRDLALAGDPAPLHRNRVGQVLCVLQALAAMAALGDALPERRVIAGYSVGELAAWGVAGCLDPQATLALAGQRADAMDAVSAPPCGLIAVCGLAQAAIADLCARHGAAIAIVNPGQGFVIGGPGPALDAVAAAARSMNARRVVRLPVEVASHTPLLAKASAAFRDRLGRAGPVTAPNADTRLLSGIDGTPVFRVEIGLDKLAEQLSRTVQWERCLEACVEGGATAFLELGPGSALSNMVADAWPGLPARSLEDFRSIDGVRAWLRGMGLGH